VAFEIRDRRVSLAKQPLELEGAKLTLSGSYAFDGALDLNVRADFRHLTRRWMGAGPEGPARARVAEVHLAGPLATPAVAPEVGVSQATR
jgi:autotransporter translocation and assembly factor TamB